MAIKYNIKKIIHIVTVWMLESATSLFLAILLLSFLSPSTLAQDKDASPIDVDRESLVRANRTMKKIDADGNGSFEKSENGKLWRRFKNLDTNNDNVISIEELQKQPKKPIAYLDTDLRPS